MRDILEFDVNEILVQVLAEVFILRPDQITLDLTKDDIGSWDSLKQMDLVVSIEKKFGVALEITDIVKMNSVKAIIEVLQDKGVCLDN